MNNDSFICGFVVSHLLLLSPQLYTISLPSPPTPVSLIVICGDSFEYFIFTGWNLCPCITQIWICNLSGAFFWLYPVWHTDTFETTKAHNYSPPNLGTAKMQVIETVHILINEEQVFLKVNELLIAHSKTRALSWVETAAPIEFAQ